MDTDKESRLQSVLHASIHLRVFLKLSYRNLIWAFKEVLLAPCASAAISLMGALIREAAAAWIKRSGGRTDLLPALLKDPGVHTWVPFGWRWSLALSCGNWTVSQSFSPITFCCSHDNNHQMEVLSLTWFEKLADFTPQMKSNLLPFCLWKLIFFLQHVWAASFFAIIIIVYLCLLFWGASCAPPEPWRWMPCPYPYPETVDPLQRLFSVPN